MNLDCESEGPLQVPPIVKMSPGTESVKMEDLESAETTDTYLTEASDAGDPRSVASLSHGCAEDRVDVVQVGEVALEFENHSHGSEPCRMVALLKSDVCYDNQTHIKNENDMLLELEEMAQGHSVTDYKDLGKRERNSTIDVVSCEEIAELSESGSLDNRLKDGDDKDGEDKETDENDFDFRELAIGAMRHVEELVRKILINISWTVQHFSNLPRWLQDNDFIWQGYRPPLPSFWDCIKSIFSIHTETGNIWTHMLGCIAFLGVGAFFLSCSEPEIRTEDKLVFTAFFTGACVCLGLSTCFHTFLCHSEWAGLLFSKLDYVGIALLIMGSFVPWLYYSFYCDFIPRITYLSLEIILGLTSIIVSLWPRFGEPKYRWLRAGLFMSFGLSGVVPAVHYAVAEGWIKALSQASLGWLILMGFLYILGTMFYALRIPERFFPGKFDIWFQSHQIFHVFVVAAAFVHYHGISEMAMHRLSVGECPTTPEQTV